MVMYYYKIKDDYVIQYFVQIDIEELKKIRTDIIENCSTITHMHYKTAKRPNQYDTEHIRNYRERFVRLIQYNDLYSTDEDEYEVEYDLLKHHEIVSYIDSLISGNTSSISKIIDAKDIDDYYEVVILNEQKKLIENLTSYGLNEIYCITKSINHNIEKLEQYSKQKAMNKYQPPIVFYQKQVLECIHLEEISKISLDIILRIQDFFGEYKKDCLEDELNKVLTLKTKK